MVVTLETASIIVSGYSVRNTVNVSSTFSSGIVSSIVLISVLV